MATLTRVKVPDEQLRQRLVRAEDTQGLERAPQKKVEAVQAAGMKLGRTMADLFTTDGPVLAAALAGVEGFVASTVAAVRGAATIRRERAEEPKPEPKPEPPAAPPPPPPEPEPEPEPPPPKKPAPRSHR